MTDIELKTLKDNLWHSADMLRAGAHLAANKYGQPILGLIFLRYADVLFKQHKDEIDEEYTAKSYGLDVLIKVMGEALPDELIKTLQHVQIACVAEKKRHAQEVVAAATVAAVGEGAVPIPFSDCALLIPTQLSMIASITVIFGFDVNKSLLTAFLSSTLGSGGVTLLGKTIVTNLLKLIPGAGSVAGGVISAGTAGVLTAGLGEAYIKVMELVFRGEMSIDDLTTIKGKEAMATFFKEELQKRSD